MKEKILFKVCIAILGTTALIGVYYFLLTQNIFWFVFSIFITLFLDNQLKYENIMEKLNNE